MMVRARVGGWGVGLVLILFVRDLVDAIVEAGLQAGEGGLDCEGFINFRGDTLTYCAVVFSFIVAFALIFA